MSLRWRLTIYSTVILGLVFVIFGTVASMAMSAILYGPVDENLRDQSQSNLLYIQKIGRMTTQVGNTGQFGLVYFTVVYPEGAVAPQNPEIPPAQTVLPAAFAGQVVWATTTLTNGARVRILAQPIYLPDAVTGQRVLTAVLQAATPLDIFDKTLGSLTVFLAVASGIMIIVAAVGANIVAGRALRVVNDVTQQAQRIETSQDLSQRITEPTTDDEVGMLVRTFNQMRARLVAAFEAQRRFVADSSHELRTPLTVIKGNLHLLKRTSDPAERAELIAITEAETSRLNRMVNDLLYIAQMQAGHDLKPVVRQVELDSLLLDVFALARSMAALKEQDLVLMHEDVASILGDRDQLQHLLLNLIDNAVKYTPAHGRVSMGLWNDGAWARIEVRDTGQGIPEADLPLLFDRFFRSPDARRTETRGSGLGLAIVKSIVEAHKGRIEVYSKLGEGSTFRVWLPMPSAPKLLMRPLSGSGRSGVRRLLASPQRTAGGDE